MIHNDDSSPASVSCGKEAIWQEVAEEG